MHTKSVREENGLHHESLNASDRLEEMSVEGVPPYYDLTRHTSSANPGSLSLQKRSQLRTVGVGYSCASRDHMFNKEQMMDVKESGRQEVLSPKCNELPMIKIRQGNSMAKTTYRSLENELKKR